jgi:hypothetical protein
MFRLYINNQLVDIQNKISVYKNQLLNDKCCIISSNLHIDHVAAYLAWCDVPGTLVALPSPIPDRERISAEIQKLSGQDVIVWTSSGTTGPQSLVAHSRSTVNQISKRSAEMQQLDSTSRVGGTFPPFTSGFYHIQLQGVHYRGGSLYIWDWANTSCPDLTHTALTAGQLDYAMNKNICFDFKKLFMAATGGSKVSCRHSEFLAKSNPQKMLQIYGLTQLGSPFLVSNFTDDADELLWVNTDSLEPDQFCLIDGELQVKNTTTAINLPGMYDSYLSTDQWYCTGDYWIQSNNLLKFDVRNNERIKVNDFLVNLPAVEETIVKKLPIVDCLVLKKSRLGSEFLHLIYTAESNDLDKSMAKKLLSEVLPAHSVPLSFEQVDALPLTGLKKKKRW